MPNYFMRPLAFFAGRWRGAWLPPLIFALIVFVGAVVLTQGKATLSFVYRFF